MRHHRRVSRVSVASPVKPAAATKAPKNFPINAKQWPLFRRAVRLMVEVFCPDTRSIGSGFVLSTSGYVITAAHVVKDGQKFRITRFRLDKQTYKLVPLKRRFTAHVVFSDGKADIAVLKINHPRGLKAAELVDSDTIEVGTPLYRVGRDDIPLGCGYVIAIGMYNGYPEITVGMPADCGSSGGPLFDLNCRVCGVALRANSDASLPPCSYALPINSIEQRLRDCEEVVPHLPPEKPE